MKKIIILFTTCTLLVFANARCQQQLSTRDSIKIYFKYIKDLKKIKKHQIPNTATTIDSNHFDSSDLSSETHNHDTLIDFQAPSQRDKIDFIRRNSSMSLCSGSRNSSGFIGAKYERKFEWVYSDFQYGAGVGFGSILGMRVSGGALVFLMNEQHMFMPLIGTEYVYSSGNQLSSKDDQPYCNVGSHQHWNSYIGVKIKPCYKKGREDEDSRIFANMFNVKLTFGYSYLLSPVRIDTFGSTQSTWTYSYNFIKNHVQSTLFFGIQLSLDIPNQRVRDAYINDGKLSDMKIERMKY